MASPDGVSLVSLGTPVRLPLLLGRVSPLAAGGLRKVVGLQATVVAWCVWCLLNDDGHVPFDILLWPLPRPKS